MIETASWRRAFFKAANTCHQQQQCKRLQKPITVRAHARHTPSSVAADSLFNYHLCAAPPPPPLRCDECDRHPRPDPSPTHPPTSARHSAAKGSNSAPRPPKGPNSLVRTPKQAYRKCTRWHARAHTHTRARARARAHTQTKLTSLRDTLGSGSGAVRSMSLSISEMSSANPFGSVVSPVVDGGRLCGSFFSRRRCTSSRPMTSIRQSSTPAVTDMIRYK